MKRTLKIDDVLTLEFATGEDTKNSDGYTSGATLSLKEGDNVLLHVEHFRRCCSGFKYTFDELWFRLIRYCNDVLKLAPDIPGCRVTRELYHEYCGGGDEMAITNLMFKASKTSHKFSFPIAMDGRDRDRFKVILNIGTVLDIFCMANKDVIQILDTKYGIRLCIQNEFSTNDFYNVDNKSIISEQTDNINQAIYLYNYLFSRMLPSIK